MEKTKAIKIEKLDYWGLHQKSLYAYKYVPMQFSVNKY